MVEQRLYGVYRGTVYSNKDPLGQGRLRLKIPQVLGTQVSEWVWPVTAEGVTVDLPETNQGVWVMFEGGDPSFPIWFGVFGKHQNQDLSVLLRHMAKNEVIERIADLIAIKSVSAVDKQVDIVETLLNLAKKLTERNCGSFYDTTIQTQTTIDTPKEISLNTTDFANNVSIVSGSRITIANVGTYNLQWSGQFANTGSSDADVRVWLRYNGVDYPQSASIVSVPAKHGSIPGHNIAAWNWLGQSQTSGDYVEIMWSVESTNVTLQSYPADGGPAVPSVIVTLTEVE